MADNSPWFKALEGVRPGMINVFMSSRQQGKTIIIDYESDDFKPQSKYICPHYAEYTNYDTGEKYWKKFNRQLKIADMYSANNIIRNNDDGTYEYIKNRETGELRVLTEEEIIWLILKAG